MMLPCVSSILSSSHRIGLCLFAQILQCSTADNCLGVSGKYTTSELRVRLAPLNRFKPSSKIFY